MQDNLYTNGRDLCGIDAHPYKVYLALNVIEHRRTKVRHPQTNEFVERFNRTILDEFFRKSFRTKYYESFDALQKDLDQWLRYLISSVRVRAIEKWKNARLTQIISFANVVRKEV